MAANSIKTNLGKDDIISDIRLMKGEDVEKKNMYVIVEGPDDIKFFRKYLSNNSNLYESFSGKNGLEEIVLYFNDRKVVGVRDRDYQESPVSTFVFYYDYCCLEIMLAMCEDAFFSVVNEFYNGEKDIRRLRRDIAQALMPYSVIRMLNEKFNWGVNFNASPIAKCLDKEGIVSVEKLINKIKNGPPSQFDEAIAKREIKRKWSDEDVFMITQGHDFMHLLAREFNRNKIRKEKDVGEDRVSCCFRTSFNFDCLKKTKLYERLKEHAEKCGTIIWNY